MNHESNIMYTCPMHPEVRQEKQGMCPECGMNLVPAGGKTKEHVKHEHEAKKSGLMQTGVDKHAGHKTNVFKVKFWTSLILSIPVVLYSDVVQMLLHWSAPRFPGSRYVPFVLASVIFFYGGWIFLVSAWRELKARLPGMMTLISIAILTAYLYSVWVVLFGQGGRTLFWELATLITVMLLGHWMEMRAVRGAQGALRELSKLLPDTAEVETGSGDTRTVPLSELKEGDIVVVRPGGKIPADGSVVEGDSEVNESLATGESKPILKRAGDQVIAGTVNGNGALKARVTQIGEHTFLAGVMQLVADAQASKSRLQLLSDRAAFYLTIIAVVAGGVTFASWLAAQAGAAFAVERLVAVLVITCPHALGLAIPLVASISTTKAARNGFLVRKRLALESARNIDVVLFDKTGTLTKGEYSVTNVWPIAVEREEDVLKLAASVDTHSEHSVSRAIVAEVKKRDITLAPAEQFQRLSGKGVSGIVFGKAVMVGGLPVLDGVSGSVPREIQEENKKGKTIIYVVSGKTLLGVLALADVIREESREAISALKARGIRVAMITGDSDDVARWVAGELGIDEYFARVLPQEKVEKVKLLQSRGEKVAMVGDGINDAPALTQADVGIAIGAGTNVAIESAGIILVKNDPRDIPKIITLSRLTYTKMIQNLFWATGYNVVAIPLAAGVLVWKGIVLQPALAAIFMSLSTVIVAVNALLLRRKSLD